MYVSFIRTKVSSIAYRVPLRQISVSPSHTPTSLPIESDDDIDEVR